MNRITDSIDRHGTILRLRAQRLEVLASNIANADTPGYKAVDVDFAAALKQAGVRRLSVQSTHPAHLAGKSASLGGLRLQERVPTQPSLDGNTVELDREIAEFTRNAVAYQARSQFLDSSIRTLRLAITGQN